MLGTTTLLFVIITLFSLCAHSSPLGKEVKRKKFKGEKEKEKKQ